MTINPIMSSKMIEKAKVYLDIVRYYIFKFVILLPIFHR